MPPHPPRRGDGRDAQPVFELFPDRRHHSFSIVWMRRLFWLVAAVVLVDTMFFAAVAPLLPHYSDELDLSKTGAGVLTAAYPAGTFVGALPAGWLAIRWGVKPTLMLGLAMLGLSSLAFAFAATSCSSTVRASSRALAVRACGPPAWRGSCRQRRWSAEAS